MFLFVFFIRLPRPPGSTRPDTLSPYPTLFRSVRAVDVVPAGAALHAEPVLVGRPIAPVDIEDLVVLHMHRGLAADAAEGAEAVHRAVGELRPRAPVVQPVGLHQRAGLTGLHALAAGERKSGV